MARIGFIGTGEIATAMVAGLANQGHQITVSKRNVGHSAKLADRFNEVTVANNQAVLDDSDFICLALMKDVAEAVLPTLKFKDDQRIVSVMVDVDLDSLQSLCAPATDISITIPLPFIETGKCPLPVYPDTGSIRELYGERNMILPLNSQVALNAHFAATAMASGMIAQMQTLSTWLADLTGDATAAEIYVVGMLGGCASSLPVDGQQRLSEALQALSTEGGLNATLRAHLDNAGVQAALIEGLDSFRLRLGLPKLEA